MPTFQYLILVGMNQPDGGVVWLLNGSDRLGSDLPRILNELGSQGWEAVGIGDLGFDSRVEIVLKKTL